MSAIELHCAQCGRFLAEVAGYGRSVCAACGSETTYRSKEERKRARLTTERAVTMLEATS